VYSERRDASKAARVYVFVFRIGGFELADVAQYAVRGNAAAKERGQECLRN
jgi:hypothetical protein